MSPRQPFVTTSVGLAALFLALLLIAGPLWVVHELRQLIHEMRNQAALNADPAAQSGTPRFATSPPPMATARSESPITRFDYPGGRFVQEDRVWREYCNPDPTFAFYFREVNRDATSLTLRDDSRGIEVKIPFQGGQSYVQWYMSNSPAWGPLHVVRPTRVPARSPAEAINAGPAVLKSTTRPQRPIIRFEHSGGRFVKELTSWIEYGNEAPIRNEFRETSRDDQWIYAHDDSRRLRARLPVNGGAMYLQPDDCHPDIWSPYVTVAPVTVDPAPALADFTPPTPVDAAQSVESGDNAVPAVERGQLVKPTPPSNTPRAFTWNYIFQPEPGQRDWRLLNDKMFVERYPSGRENVFVILRPDTVETIRGTLVQIVGGQMQAFIPDKGSKNMSLHMRASETANWQVMGQISTLE